MTPLTKVLDLFGSQRAVAEVCGVTREAVAQWKLRGRIPAKHQRSILIAARVRGLSITADDLLGVDSVEAPVAA